jgi:hypothetical protein
VCCGGTFLQSSPAILMPFVAERAFGWKPAVIDESWGLQTIRTGTAYALCNSLWCADCGLLFLDIRFSDREMDGIYRDYRGPDYTRLREHYEPGYALRNRQLDEGVSYIADVEAFLRPLVGDAPRVLDWGGDTGKNTPFRGKAAVCDVYDISDKPLVAGARRVTEDMARGSRYDLVVCSNVLEHIPYPADTLEAIGAAMDDDAVLYIEVPFEEAVRTAPVQPQLRKKHWHEHINFFSESSLHKLAAGCGLQVVASAQLFVTTAGKSSHLFQLACRRRRAAAAR